MSTNLVYVRGGLFTKGYLKSFPNIKGSVPEKVKLSNFYISRYCVTHNEFFTFCKEERIYHGNYKTKEPDTKPAVHVSWYDAILYCNYVSKKEELTPCYDIKETCNNKQMFFVSFNNAANGYRLPSEAEWEYAAREKGNDILCYEGINCNYKLSDPFTNILVKEETCNVSENAPNSLGLYNMCGNVWEWCYDTITKYPDTNNVQVNPMFHDTNNTKVTKGGSYNSHIAECFIITKKPVNACDRSAEIGFRLAKNI